MEGVAKWWEPASVQLEEGTEAIDNSLKETTFRIIQNIWLVSVAVNTRGPI